MTKLNSLFFSFFFSFFSFRLLLHPHTQGIAAKLDIQNVDTDMIIPKQFLKTIKRTGLGVSAFFELRYDPVSRC